MNSLMPSNVFGDGIFYFLDLRPAIVLQKIIQYKVVTSIISYCNLSLHHYNVFAIGRHAAPIKPAYLDILATVYMLILVNTCIYST